MSLVNFKALASRHPDEVKTVERLATLLNAPESAGKVFTLSRLADLVEPNSKEELAFILAELVRAELLRHFVRVESPSTGRGIGDFDDIEHVPNIIYDRGEDRDLEITSENLRALYTLRAPTRGMLRTQRQD
jgi:hypothetical protein